MIFHKRFASNVPFIKIIYVAWNDTISFIVLAAILPHLPGLFPVLLLPFCVMHWS
jgi:hypothetical protein